MVGFGGPGVDLDGVAQRNDQELDALVLDDLEVDGAGQIAHVDPSRPRQWRSLIKKRTDIPLIQKLIKTICVVV